MLNKEKGSPGDVLSAAFEGLISPQEEAADAQEEKEKTSNVEKKVSESFLESKGDSEFAFPWCTLNSSYRPLSLHPSVKEFAERLLRVPRRQLYKDSFLALISYETLWRFVDTHKISKVHRRVYLYNLLTYLQKEKLVKNFSSYSYSPKAKGERIFFTLCFSHIKEDDTCPSLEEIGEDFYPKNKKPEIKKTLSLPPPCLSSVCPQPQTKLPHKMVLDFLFFLKTASLGSLVVSLPKPHIERFFQVRDVSSALIKGSLNELLQSKEIFFWDVSFHAFTAYYYIVFTPKLQEEVNFFLKMYFLGKYAAPNFHSPKWIDVSEIGQYLGIPFYQITQALSDLEKNYYLEVLETSPLKETRKKIKFL